MVGFGRTINAKDELTGASNQATGLIEFAAPVRAGDSGGPMVNGAGQVVGVTTAATVNFRMDPGGSGFAIPINDALATAGQIRSRVAIEHRAHRTADPARGRGQLPQPARVACRASSSSRCCAAGLRNRQACTTVTSCSASTVSSSNSATALTDVLDRHYPGDVVDLVWIDRTGQQLTGKATLGS